MPIRVIERRIFNPSGPSFTSAIFAAGTGAAFDATVAIVDRSGMVVGVDKPSPATTGVLPGITRSELAGNQTVTVAGTVLQDRNIRGLVDVRAANVVLRNCLVDGAATTGLSSGKALVTATNAACTNLLIEDCTLAPAAPNRFWNGVFGSDFTARRLDISRVTDPFDPFDTASPGANLNALMELNWLHDYAFFNDAGQSQDLRNHADGMQIQGGTGITFRGNLVESYWATDVGDVDYAGGGTGGFAPVANFRVVHPTAKSCIQVNDLSGVIPGPAVSITDNWLFGGDVSINGNDSTFTGGANSLPFGEILRNRLSRDQPIAVILLATALSVNTGAGTADKNVFDDNGAEVTVQRV